MGDLVDVRVWVLRIEMVNWFDWEGLGDGPECLEMSAQYLPVDVTFKILELLFSFM